MGVRKDLSNEKFGRLEVIKRGRYDRKSYWICKCDCGKEVEVSSDKLGSGHTRSCGCYRDEQISKSNGTHHMSGTRFYITWRNMVRRCHDVRDSAYARYGGIGLTVEENWHMFENFMDDMFATYEENLQIDRIDNAKGYSKDNCRWVSCKQNNNNRRNNIRIRIDGVTKNLCEWCEDYKLPYPMIYARIKRGWKIDETLFRGKIQ